MFSFTFSYFVTVYDVSAILDFQKLTLSVIVMFVIHVYSWYDQLEIGCEKTDKMEILLNIFEVLRIKLR